MRCYVITVVLLLSCLASSVSADSPVAAVRLSLEVNRALPCIPVPYIVEIENTSRERIWFGTTARLRVRREGEAPFFARWPMMDNELGLITRQVKEKDLFELEPGKRMALGVSLETQLTASSWFSDPRLSAPGKYKLHLLVAVATANDYFEVASNEESLEIGPINEDDAIVWEEMQKVIKENKLETCATSLSFVVTDIWRDHPGSNYAQVVAAFVPTPVFEVRIANIERGIAIDPDTPMANALRLNMAELLRSQALVEFNRLYDEPDEALKPSMETYARARALLETALARTQNPGMKASIEEVLVKVPTPEQQRADMRARREFHRTGVTQP